MSFIPHSQKASIIQRKSFGQRLIRSLRCLYLNSHWSLQTHSLCMSDLVFFFVAGFSSCSSRPQPPLVFLLLLLMVKDARFSGYHYVMCHLYVDSRTVTMIRLYAKMLNIDLQLMNRRRTIKLKRMIETIFWKISLAQGI